MKKSPEKSGFHPGPKDASSAYLFFIRVRVPELVSLQGTTLGILRARLRVRVTQLGPSTSLD